MHVLPLQASEPGRASNLFGNFKAPHCDASHLIKGNKKKEKEVERNTRV